MNRIDLDRRLAGRALMLALLFCWPLFIFGRPAYFPDTLGYYTGGTKVVTFLTGIIPGVARQADLPTTVAASTPTASAAGAVKGARSVPYSILTALLAGPHGTLVPLALFQAVLTGFTVAVLLAGAGFGARTSAAIGLGLAVATPAAWLTCFAMPDIFAALTILAIAMLAVWAERLAPPVAILLGLTVALGIATHTSHLALVLVLAPLALLWGGPRSRVGIAAAALIGVAVVVVGGVAGFGTVSLAPRRFPLTLARSIEDGPARWYLARACAEPRYAVCEIYGGRLPTTTTAFLWGPRGVVARATPAQMERLRAEEPEILWRSFAAYPGATIAAALHGIGRQLVFFRVAEANYDVRIATGNDGRPVLAADPVVPAGLAGWVDRLSRLTATVALGWLVLCLPRAAPSSRRLAVMIVVGVVANAAICAVLSSVSDRYQARVVWLLPLAAVLVRPLGRAGSPACMCNDIL